MQRIARLLRSAGAGLPIAVLACGGDLTLPRDGGVGGAGGLDLAVVAGDGQTGTVGEPLPARVVVELRGPAGEPVAGRQVAFLPDTGSGGFTPDPAVTDAQGRASTSWGLGTTVGACTGTARLVETADSGVPTVQVTAAAVAGQADTVFAVSPTVLVGRRGDPASAQPTVKTVDRFGNPVAGVQVSWKADGDGDVSDEQTTTGPDGRTSVAWTFGRKSAVQHLTARVDGLAGSPVIFMGTVLF